VPWAELIVEEAGFAEGRMGFEAPFAPFAMANWQTWGWKGLDTVTVYERRENMD
jgi:hypothetical protein